MNGSLDDQCRAFCAELRDFIKELRAARKSDLEEFAKTDPRIRSMMTDKGKAIAALQAQDSVLKQWALFVLLGAYPHNVNSQTLVPIFEQLAFGDPSPEVRHDAMIALASRVYVDGNRRKIKTVGRRLSAIVLNESVPTESRSAAYRALIHLSDRIDLRRRSIEDPKFPYLQFGTKRIDWGFVQEWQRVSTIAKVARGLATWSRWLTSRLGVRRSRQGGVDKSY
jgi:hypothetical protein